MESKTKAINPSRLESFFDDDYKQQDHIVCIDFFFFVVKLKIKLCVSSDMEAGAEKEIFLSVISGYNELYTHTHTHKHTHTQGKNEQISSKRSENNLGRETFLSNPKESMVYKRVLKDSAGGVFNTCSLSTSKVPTSEAEGVFYSAPRGESNKALALKREHLTMSGVVQPEPYLIDKPDNLDQYLLSPKQRRAHLLYETEKQKVRRLARKAKSDTKRMLDLMEKRYPTGILSMQKQDSSSLDSRQPDRDVYRSLRKSIEREQKKEETARSIKLDRKKKNMGGITRRGYDFMRHDDAAPVSDRVACRLGRTNRTRLTIAQSRDRIFDTSTSPVKGSGNKLRMEYLRSKNNRDFDVISGRPY